MSKLKQFLFLLVFCFTTPFLAFADESITITTYYPSPYGSYDQLSTNKLVVGSSVASDQPKNNGSIRLMPQGDPATWSPGQPGEFAYSSSKDDLYHYNGSAWVAAGGGGAPVILITAGPLVVAGLRRSIPGM